MRSGFSRLILACALGAACVQGPAALADDTPATRSGDHGVGHDMGRDVGHDMGHDMSHTDHGAPAPANTPADAAYMKAMQGMNAAMSAPMTGDADVDFVTMMLPHHQGAVDMAKAALDHAKDPFVRELAANVVRTQASEIAEMNAWLATRGKAAKPK